MDGNERPRQRHPSLRLRMDQASHRFQYLNSVLESGGAVFLTARGKGAFVTLSTADGSPGHLPLAALAPPRPEKAIPAHRSWMRRIPTPLPRA